MKTQVAEKILSVFLVLSFSILPTEIRHGSNSLQSFKSSSRDLLWFTEEIGPTASCFDMNVSLALGTDSLVHVSYYNSDQQALMYAQRTAAGWVITTVDNSGAAGRDSSIALDGSANPHIAYRDMGTNQLKYASLSNGIWTYQAIGSIEFGWQPSLSIDRQDRPHIAYLGYTSAAGSQTPKYAYWDGHKWLVDVIDEVFTWGGISLALDANDLPHVSYLANGALRYGTYIDAQWITQTVDQPEIQGRFAGAYSSLAINERGDPQISYALYGVDVSPPFPVSLKFAHRQAGEWQLTQLDTGSQYGFFSSIGLDTQQSPHISYYDSHQQALKYIHLDGLTWKAEIIDAQVKMDGYTSLAVGADGLPQIAYCDEYSGAVKLARLLVLDKHFFLPLIKRD